MVGLKKRCGENNDQVFKNLRREGQIKNRTEQDHIRIVLYNINFVVRKRTWNDL